MNKSTKTMLTLGALAVVLTLGVMQAPTLSGSDGELGTLRRAPNVAVVDIEKVINDYLKSTGDMDRVRAKYASDRRALDVIRDTIDSMTQEASIYPQDSEEYLNISTQIAVKKAEHQVRSKGLEAGLNRDQGKLMLEAFRKAEDVIKTYAKEKGLDMVHQIQRTDIKGVAYESVSSQLIVRSVLYATDGLDVTDEIIARMR